MKFENFTGQPRMANLIAHHITFKMSYKTRPGGYLEWSNDELCAANWKSWKKNQESVKTKYHDLKKA